MKNATINTETLTDGSEVYNVELLSDDQKVIVIHAINEEHAKSLCDQLNMAVGIEILD